MFDLGVLYAAGFALGLAVIAALGLARGLPLPAMALATVALGVLSLAVFAGTYQDEFCDQDTGCRLFAGPSYFLLRTVVPGMLVGLIAVWLSRSRPSRSGQH